MFAPLLRAPLGALIVSAALVHCGPMSVAPDARTDASARDQVIVDDAPRDHAIVDDVPLDHAAAADASDGASGGDANLCVHDPFPTVPNRGGPRLAAPQLVVVTFADEPNRDALEAFSRWIVTSDWLAQVGAEYGVSLGAVASVVRLTSTAPAAQTDAQIQEWLAASVDDGTLPTPAGGFANALYVVYYPPTSQITVPSAGTTLASCTGFGGYHGSVSAHSPAFAYAVVPDCPSPPEPGLSPLEYEEFAASHELIEAATDADPHLHPAYLYAGDPSTWSALGSEVGDLCSGASARFDGFVVQQVWSNAAAAIGLDPCIPSNTMDPYYNVSVPAPLVRVVDPGDAIDIPVTGWSTRPIADWNVEAIAQSLFDPPITARLDASTLNDCVTHTLHVQIPAGAPANGLAGVTLRSSRSTGEAHEWGVAFLVSAGAPGSCTTGEICTDYGPGFTPMLVMTSCPAPSGTYSPGACSPTGRVGRCVHTITTGGFALSITQSFYSPLTAATAMSICVSSSASDMVMYEPG